MNKAVLMAMVMGCCVLGTAMVYAQGSDKVVTDGMAVKFDYTLTVDAEEVETTKNKQPLEYMVGQNMLIPALEKELMGMKVGDTKVVTLKPEEAYGLVSPDAVREMDKAKIPTDIAPQVGMILEMQDPEGNSYPAIIKEVKDQTIVLDFNHPLAGKDLKFDVKIAAVETAPVVPPVPDVAVPSPADVEK